MREEDVRHELVDPRRIVEYHDPSDFDRVAFAMQALDRLRPPRMTIAVVEAVANFYVERGRDLRRDGASWAIVGIPPHASREQIAYALAELVGVESVPYAVHTLLGEDRNAYR